MGRAGSGGGGGHSSGGGHSFSHSSGGHRVGGGGRPTGSSGGSSYRGSSFNHHHTVTHHHHYGPSYGRHSTYYGGGRPPAYSITAFIVVLLIVIVIKVLDGGTGVNSTIQRYKLETGNAYINDCVIDETGWINNKSKLSSKLKDFYKKTGVQPYIIMKGYDSSLTSDSAKEQWARRWYDDNLSTQGREDVFLYVYFAEASDSDVGYMAYVTGFEAASVMDDEAVSIFWKYLDKYWSSYDEDDTDGMFYATFRDTGKTIMKVTTTGKDLLKWGIIAVVVIGGLGLLIVIRAQKRKHEHEKAEETERILNTPLDGFGVDSDPLTRKYRD